MKLITTLTLALAADAVSAAALQARHYLFPALTGTADWSSVRITANHYSNGPVTDVTSSALRCYELTPGTSAAATQSVAAGSSVSFKVTPNIFHQGPLQFYMAKVPSGETAATWDGSGNVWFKIFAEKANVANGALTWGSMNAATASVTIPKNTPSGEYLLRIEHIALHSASAINGAQIYLSCAQIKVTGGGSGTPGPLVTFPGAYVAGEKGLQVNIYSGQTSYTPPGPAVWTG
ncbi:lytic polysaccharide monooxygenase [Macroventuria anomochaeta]|uniref:Lytic polysaccharide monooxygenase n=1 Tax=Macroventuria anomochaeta TaxID=301207 RepID=A0ACB6SEP9_9PLEO|nr:lytic polysaccharide monooxygenase [Macroventuria anomochaeta]KAF2632701.1 lytic polysaccharide monooxygenase [Macroventuria anomochaeta]